jgi:hypothetical protein
VIFSAFNLRESGAQNCFGILKQFKSDTAQLSLKNLQPWALARRGERRETASGIRNSLSRLHPRADVMPYPPVTGSNRAA